MDCERTQFSEETSVQIELEDDDGCGGCGDGNASARVRYNGKYCHVASADFTAYPTGIPPCSSDSPPPTDPPVLEDPDLPIEEDDPPVSDPPPVEPPPDLPPDPPTDEEGDEGDGGGSSDGDGEDPDPPVDPPDPPTIPDSTIRFARVASGSTGGETYLPDALKQNPSGFPLDLARARANGWRVILRLFRGYPSQQTQVGDPELNPASPLYDPTAVLGGFNLRRAKEQISLAQNLLKDMRSFVTDGTIIYHMLMDDIGPGATGPIWSGRNATGAELDDLAHHSKRVTGWATVPTGLRTPAWHLKNIKPVGGWQYLDIAHVQMPLGAVTGGGGATASLDPLSFFRAEIANATGIGLGFHYGCNLLDGGSGPLFTGGWALRPNIQSKYGMSPTEIRRAADAIESLGNFRGHGCNFWSKRSYYPPGGSESQLTSYFYRSDIQAALSYFKDAVENLKVGPVNYR